MWVYEQPNHTFFTRGLGYEMEFSSLYGKSYNYIDLVHITTIFDKNGGQCIYEILSKAILLFKSILALHFTFFVGKIIPVKAR